MIVKKLPFNVELLDLTAARLSNLRPVTSIEFFESSNGDLHDDGLFSVPIFGRVGSDERDYRFSYIDIKLEVMHPVIYERLVKLKNLYKGIIAGTHYVLWNDEAGDFIPADELRGQTGYSYFMKHWKKIRFARNDSAIRDMRIQLIEKYRSRSMTSKILVMPAGLRDIETGDDGRIKFADINTIYRRLLSVASTIPVTDDKDVDPVHDRARNMLQSAFNDLYSLIEQMLTGKKGFFQRYWASRAVFNSTRNVITSANLATAYLGGVGSVKYTETILGMHQASRMLLPVVMFQLKQLLADTFSHGDNRAMLVDPKTLTAEIVEISPENYDRWMTSDGLERVIASYGEVSLRDKPVMIEGRYLGLVYRGPDMTFRLLKDVSELPEDRKRRHVHPLTLVELIYISMYDKWSNYHCLTTRYPVTGVGSMFPASVRVRTTITGEIRKELDSAWQPVEDDRLAIEYPVFPITSYLDSHVINGTRLKGLGGDFDGDMVSCTAVISDEANNELKTFLTTKNAFIDPRGDLKASSSIPTIDMVALNMLGRI